MIQDECLIVSRDPEGCHLDPRILNVCPLHDEQNVVWDRAQILRPLTEEEGIHGLSLLLIGFGECGVHEHPKLLRILVDPNEVLNDLLESSPGGIEGGDMEASHPICWFSSDPLAVPHGP